MSDPFVVAVFVVLAVAFVVGYLANTRVRPFAKSEVQGVKLELLISPLLTLTVLLLAFVLVQVFGSYKASRDAAALEAGRVLFQYDVIDYYDDGRAQPMQEALICYSRAVAYQEWPWLADNATPEQTASRWGAGLDPTLAALRTEDNAQPYGTLLAAEKDRQDGRRLRVVQARPAVPTEIELLLLGISAAAVFGIAAFTLPYVSRRTQAGALIVLATSLALVQVAIVDLDDKYAGLIQVEPTDFLFVDDALSARFAQRFGEQSLPCDEQGLPA